jgi:hypothetical protein
LAGSIEDVDGDCAEELLVEAIEACDILALLVRRSVEGQSLEGATTPALGLEIESSVTGPNLTLEIDWFE